MPEYIQSSEAATEPATGYLDFGPEDVLAALGVVEAALAVSAPRDALECLSVAVPFSYADLVFPLSDTARLRALASVLVSWRDGRSRRPAQRAPELSSAVVSLHPEAVTFDRSGWPPGSVMRDVLDQRVQDGKTPWIFSGESAPVRVPVRGADRAEAQRKITWLFTQMGVPAHA